MNENTNDYKNTFKKLDYLKKELIDKDKCREFAKKLEAYIKSKEN